MVQIAVLHATLPQLLAQSSNTHTGGFELVRSAADVGTFRSGLATQSVDALILSLGLLGSQPLREIDRLRRYTRARAVIVTHNNFVSAQLLQAVQAQDDLLVAREPVTPSRLRGLLARVLDSSDFAGDGSQAQVPATVAEVGPERWFDELVAQPSSARRFDDVELSRIFDEAVTGDYEFTQYVAELLIHLSGFEDYCRRRNAGRESTRGLHTEVERSVGHSRALFEEALTRLTVATGLAERGPGEQAVDGEKVIDLATSRGRRDSSEGG